jgi:hypothetical protein
MKLLQQLVGLFVRLLLHNAMLEEQHNAEMLYSPHSAYELRYHDNHCACSLSLPPPSPANQFPEIPDQDLSILAGGKHSIHSETNKQINKTYEMFVREGQTGEFRPVNLQFRQTTATNFY